MSDMQCGYLGDREATLIAYTYDEIDRGERDAFEAHLSGCAQCRAEVAALSGVRRQLAAWNPPSLPTLTEPGVSNPESRMPSSESQAAWWRSMPAWAQVAAAMLFVGISAGLANLDVHRDATGLTIRTGWMRADAAAARDAVTRAATSAAAPAMSRVIPAQADASSGAVVSRADLIALEQRLRAEMHSAPAAARATAADPDLLRKVRALVDESEKRQQRELALRLAQAMTDIAAQRQADLRKIDTTLTGVQRDLGIQVLQQRERMNYLMRVNQRQ